MKTQKHIKKGKVEKDLKEQLARALADYDNLQKRHEREKENLEKLASLRIITKLLPSLDMLEDVQDHLNDSGLAIVIKEFEDGLKEEGIERIDASPGTKFDEDLHEAVEVVKNDSQGAGEIVEQRASGWKFEEGFIIRPAKVVVNKSKGVKE